MNSSGKLELQSALLLLKSKMVLKLCVLHITYYLSSQIEKDSLSEKKKGYVCFFLINGEVK